jgi:hypothetical protein
MEDFLTSVLALRNLLDNDKDRIKKARADGIAKEYHELGRRVKISGEIEVVTKATTNPARHAKELYVRLTTQGKQWLQQSNPLNDSNKIKRGGASHVFIKYLPAESEVKELVQFIESVHSWSIDRAAVVPTKPGSTSNQAHIEFTNASDAADFLKSASSSDGFMYKGRQLPALPDQWPPTYPGNDPLRFYESHRISAEVSSAAQLMVSRLLSKTYTQQQSESPSQGSAGSSLVVDEEAPRCVEVSLICRVIYENCFGGTSDFGNITSHQQWKNAANIAAEFQKLLKRPSEERKDTYKKALHTVISEGLVELGRRVLSSKTREVTLSPYFTGPGRPPPNLSAETYLQLTTKGVNMAESAPGLKRQNVAPSINTSKNMFIQNLPRSANIHDFVKYLERTYAINIRLVCFARLHPSAKCAAAHVEFEKLKIIIR